MISSALDPVDEGNMLILALGIVVFLGAHVLITFRDTRTRLIERIGLGPYKIAYSLASVRASSSSCGASRVIGLKGSFRSGARPYGRAISRLR